MQTGVIPQDFECSFVNLGLVSLFLIFFLPQARKLTVTDFQKKPPMLGRGHISLGLCADRTPTTTPIFGPPPLCTRHYHVLVSSFHCVSPCYCFVVDFLTFLGAFAKFRKVTISFFMSVRLSAWNNSAFTGRIVHEMWYFSIFRTSVQKNFKFH